jgi:hypothetical protein
MLISSLQITPFLFQAIGYGTLLLLFGLNTLCIPFIIFIYPETAGWSLEQMDTYFEHGDTWNVFKANKNIHDKEDEHGRENVRRRDKRCEEELEEEASLHVKEERQ